MLLSHLFTLALLILGTAHPIEDNLTPRYPSLPIRPILAMKRDGGFQPSCGGVPQCPGKTGPKSVAY